MVSGFKKVRTPAFLSYDFLINSHSDASRRQLEDKTDYLLQGADIVYEIIFLIYGYFHVARISNYRNAPVLRKEKRIESVLLFPSAVLTASGSKGISQHKAPLKFSLRY
jgi:hypothetical protein